MKAIHWLTGALIWTFFGTTSGYEREYLTSLVDSTGDCNHESSLEYGFTVSWDPDNRFGAGEFAFRPGWMFHCIISFKPRQELDGMPTRTSLTFRDAFHFADVGLSTTGSSVEDCGKAWIKLYSTPEFLLGNDPIWTHCSVGALPGLNSQYVFDDPNIPELTLEFFVDFNIQVINNATVNPNLTTTTLITTPNPRDYPRIHFHADFTAYVHNDTCINPNDEVYLRCNDSRRCLARTDVCDTSFGRNCRTNEFLNDNSDLVSGYPSFCGRQTLPEIEIDLLPLWIVLGLLGAAMVMYWCFWKPGYIPWRCGRLRNVQGGCCGSADGKGCCAAGGMCGPGGLCGKPTPEGKSGKCSWCSKCFSCCQGGGSGGRYGVGGGGGGRGYRPMGGGGGGGRPLGLHTGGKTGRGKGDAGKQGAAAGDWFDYCAGDGFHLVECR